MSTVLVAGANGFVGAHVVAALRARGITVWGLVRTLPVDWRLNGLDDVPALAGDITDTQMVNRAVADVRPTIVINAATYGVDPTEQDPDRMFAVNVLGAHNLAHACRSSRVRRLVQLGSYWEYGDHAETITEETALEPKTLYGATKAAASLLIAAGDAAPAEGVVLRLFNLWGPGEAPHRLIPSVIAAVRAKKPLDLTAGTQIKDYAYVRDVARWIVDIALKPGPLPHRVYNLASGRRMAVKDLAHAAARALNGADLLRFGAKPMPEGEVQTGPADTARIDGVLSRDVTPLDDALDQMMA